MTDKERDAIIAEGAAEEVKEKANATFEESIKALSDEEKTAKRTEREAVEGDKAKVDYKKITAAERLRREKAENALAQQRIKDKKEKKKDGDDEEDDEEEDDSKTLTRGEAKAMLNKNRDEAEAAGIIKELAGTDATLAETALNFWKKTPLQGIKTVKEQIEFVLGGLASGKLLAKVEELKRALGGKGKVRQGGVNGTKVDVGADEPEMASHERQALADSGFIWDATQKLYKRVLAGSKKALFYDPVKKKRFTKVV